jgi:NTE family protein
MQIYYTNKYLPIYAKGEMKVGTAKQTVSLVLGGGGARGYAHIGVIEELLKHGYEIKSISGSSIGALIGALYVSEKLQEYKEWH